MSQSQSSSFLPYPCSKCSYFSFYDDSCMLPDFRECSLLKMYGIPEEQEDLT